MGLGYMIAIAAAAAASQRRRGSSRKTTSYGGDRECYGSRGPSYYEEKPLTYYDYVKRELNNQESPLRAFFEQLKHEHNRLCRQKYEILSEKQKSIEKKMNEYREKTIFELQSKNKAITVRYDISDESWIIRCNDVTIQCNYRKNTDIFSQLQDELNMINKRKKTLLETKKKDEEELEQKRLQFRYNIFKRKQIKSGIVSLTNSIRNNEQAIKNYDKRITKIEYLLSLNNHTKQKIIDASKCIESNVRQFYYYKDKKEKGNKDIEQVQHCIGDYYYHERIDPNAIEEALKNLLDRNEITQETIESVFLLLDKVEIFGRRGKYNNDSARDSQLTGIAMWFVINIYEKDETFVTRNYNLHQEQEEQGKTLTKKTSSN